MWLGHLCYAPTSHRDWNGGPLSSLMTVFQRDGSLRKTFPGCRIFTSQKVGERICNCNAQKVNALRKGWLGFYYQKNQKNSLKFSQPREDVQVWFCLYHGICSFLLQFCLQYQYLRNNFFIGKINFSSNNFLKCPKF